jgi:nucleoside-diphosphate-sugar epimerase
VRVLVTGNMGYIGSVLGPMLVDAGYEVWGIDTGYYYDCFLGESNNDQRSVHHQLYKDMRDITAADLAGVDAVVHLAALSNDPTGALKPGLTEEINYKASVRLAELARQAGVSRYVFASSCSIYGQGESKALTEEVPFHPLTAYARSKVNTEAEVSALANDDFSPVFLRNGTAYGYSPRLRFDIVLNNLMGWAFTTGQVKLLSDGTAWRPLVHVADISAAILASLVAQRERIHNQSFNVGQDSENYQIRTIAETVASVVPGSEVTFAEGASADNRTYHVSFAKIRKLLPEFKPAWNIEKSAKRLYAAFQEAGITFEDFQGRKFTRLKQLNHLLELERLDEDFRWKGKAGR